MGFIWYWYPEKKEIYVPDSNAAITGIETFEDAKKFFDSKNDRYVDCPGY